MKNIKSNPLLLSSCTPRSNLSMASSSSGPSRSEEDSFIDLNKPSTSSQETVECEACGFDRFPSEIISHYSKRFKETHRFCIVCLSYRLNQNGYNANCIFCLELLKEEDYFHLISPSQKSIIMMIKEEKAIPVKERVYCTNPKCSALHSKTEARVPKEEILKLDYDASGLAECKKCKQRFCLDCGVSWHDFMSCEDYKISGLSLEEENDDKKLLLLAENEFWDKCEACGSLIEHDGGCQTIKCRCGNKFKSKNLKDKET